ncbi:MAG: DUF4132 domain-containing protein, partial [Candidatus Eremiobacteraeota bacterium]|nr:DUF4132 domain-containing protein [Candidatus Eremiobacteraeota bacterium]
VKAELDSDSLERFAWALFELWWQAGARSAAWAFHAMGWLGGDDCVRRLTALMRGQWLRDKQHKFTLEGLEVLAAIGTDLALMHLSSLANKSPVKKAREKADEMLEVVADHRQLSREELEDRIVPDLGLGPDGTRPLDFGPRQFVLAFDERLEPRVFEDGRPLARYPRPNASDDPAKVAEAGKLWKDFKKDAARLVPEQVSRLERAMAGRRRWTPAQFEQFFCHHPFLAHLSRRLVWAVHHDQRVEGFRLAEDGTYADWQDDQFELPGDGLVGVAHPLELDQLASWHELFADYQILQHFPQLHRPTYRPDGHNPLPALEQTVGFGPLLALEKRGWQRGQVVGMGLRELTKELPDGLTASLRFEPGVLLDIVKESQPQRVTGLFLSGDEPARFEQLHPVLCSELFLDYYGLTGR